MPNGWGNWNWNTERPSWDVNDQIAQWMARLRNRPQNPAGYGFVSDPLLRQERDLILADTAAAQRGARSAARTSAGNDPSLWAYADLASMIGGQSQAADTLGRASFARMSDLDRRAWEEYMMRERAKLEEEMMKRANAGGWLGDLGQVAGLVGGSWLMPGGLWGKS